MGCFDKTCCLTNTGISEGEECLVVVLNSKTNSLYNIMKEIHYQLERESQEFSVIEKGLIKDNPDLFDIGDFLPIKNVFYGTYNDYGSIEEDENIPKDYEEFRMEAQMFHIWAIEELFRVKIKELIKKPIELVRDLYSKMFFLRKSPFDLHLSGQQHKDIEEMELMVRMNEKTNQYLKLKIKEDRKML